MWQALWPGVPEDEIPIGHVTNGVHFRTWISPEMNQLYDRYLGPTGARSRPTARLWKRVRVDSRRGAVAHARAAARAAGRLCARRRLRAQLERRGAPQAEIEAADEVLDPDALTIGFARRFATYKRATLLLRDLDRLAAHPQRPGPAGADHLRRQGPPARRRGQGADPPDRRRSRAQPEFRRRIVFLEDYDMAVARYLVQGVRRLAEHPAAAAGGQRHQRHEGRRQRRAAT